MNLTKKRLEKILVFILVIAWGGTMLVGGYITINQPNGDMPRFIVSAMLIVIGFFIIVVAIGLSLSVKGKKA